MLGENRLIFLNTGSESAEAEQIEATGGGKVKKEKLTLVDAYTQASHALAQVEENVLLKRDEDLLAHDSRPIEDFLPQVDTVALEEFMEPEHVKLGKMWAGDISEKSIGDMLILMVNIKEATGLDINTVAEQRPTWKRYQKDRVERDIWYRTVGDVLNEEGHWEAEKLWGMALGLPNIDQMWATFNRITKYFEKQKHEASLKAAEKIKERQKEKIQESYKKENESSDEYQQIQKLLNEIDSIKEQMLSLESEIISKPPEKITKEDKNTLKDIQKILKEHGVEIDKKDEIDPELDVSAKDLKLRAEKLKIQVESKYEQAVKAYKQAEKQFQDFEEKQNKAMNAKINNLPDLKDYLKDVTEGQIIENMPNKDDYHAWQNVNKDKPITPTTLKVISKIGDNVGISFKEEEQTAKLMIPAITEFFVDKREVAREKAARKIKKQERDEIIAAYQKQIEEEREKLLGPESKAAKEKKLWEDRLEKVEAIQAEEKQAKEADKETLDEIERLLATDDLKELNPDAIQTLQSEVKEKKHEEKKKKSIPKESVETAVYGAESPVVEDQVENDEHVNSVLRSIDGTVFRLQQQFDEFDRSKGFQLQVSNKMEGPFNSLKKNCMAYSAKDKMYYLFNSSTLDTCIYKIQISDDNKIIGIASANVEEGKPGSMTSMMNAEELKAFEEEQQQKEEMAKREAMLKGGEGPFHEFHKFDDKYLVGINDNKSEIKSTPKDFHDLTSAETIEVKKNNGEKLSFKWDQKKEEYYFYDGSKLRFDMGALEFNKGNEYEITPIKSIES